MLNICCMHGSVRRLIIIVCLLGLMIGCSTPDPEPTETPGLDPLPTSTSRPVETEAVETVESVAAVTATVPSASPVPTVEEKEADSTTCIESYCTLVEGRLRIGVQDDFWPFSYVERGNRTGFEIDLATEMSYRWFQGTVEIDFIPLSGNQRLNALGMDCEDGSCFEVDCEDICVDFVIASMTWTEERCRAVDCSSIYFQDSARLLVKADSTITGICDLDGQFVSALAGTTAEKNIKDQMPRWCEYQVSPGALPLDPRAEAIAAVKRGDAAAYTTDGRALEGFARNDPELKVVGDGFTAEPYTMAVRRGNETLLRYINLTLQQLKIDSTYDVLYATHFGCEETPFLVRVDAGAEIPDLAKVSETDIPPMPSQCESIAQTDLDESAPEAQVTATPPAQGTVAEELLNDETTYYFVQAGDTLGGIARDQYGDFNLFDCIQDANEEIDRPSLIRADTWIAIPELKLCIEEGYGDG